MPLHFDPRDFILPPYLRCPACGEESFGILWIGGSRYSRRCKACRHTVETALPKIKKRVIYLDQFAVSNMMKALNPAVKGHESAKREPLWLAVFDELDVLVRGQLIVCPSSEDHRTESMFAPFYPALKSMYDYLAWGVEFQNSEFIHRSHLVTAADAWLQGSEPVFEFNAQDVIHGRLDEWGDRMQITIKGEYPAFVDGLREAREQVFEGITEAFRLWQSSSRPSFAGFFADEWRGYAERTLRIYADVIEKHLKVALGAAPMTEDLIWLPPAAITVGILADAFESRGIPPDKARPKVVEFFRSETPSCVPFLRIASSLFAVLAMKAAAGQKRPPNRGTATDVNIVASLMPYCDAMFIDNTSASLLNDVPREFELPYPCKVFSPRTGQEFLTYLRGLREAMTAEHRALVESLYGRDWDQPNRSLFAR
jgi:transcription elongation factor Elf1